MWTLTQQRRLEWLLTWKLPQQVAVLLPFGQHWVERRRGLEGERGVTGRVERMGRRRQEG